MQLHYRILSSISDNYDLPQCRREDAERAGSRVPGVFTQIWDMCLSSPVHESSREQAEKKRSSVDAATNLEGAAQGH